MAVSSSYKCDSCGIEKGSDADHSITWYTLSDLWPTNKGEMNEESVGIHHWPKYKDANGVKHLCGAECVMKYVAKFLGAK